MFLDTDSPIIVALCRQGFLLADPNEAIKLRNYAPSDVRAELTRHGCADVDECESATDGTDCVVECGGKVVTVEFMTLTDLSGKSLESLSRHISKGVDVLIVYPIPNPPMLERLRELGEVVKMDIKDLLNVCYSDYKKGTIVIVNLSKGRVIESRGKKFRVFALR